ncbi:hypothetical protein CHS0354_019642 [Potamilus streckersoni]|uniref:TIR domain-containing protein n=1 Tax=Potamilus streckersoni TaxID=2493646 RepID=A0AAE0T9V5_9BIVA|nr:hypothetical protein CHS0354_019642 [Potamilus streckersoni]
MVESMPPCAKNLTTYDVLQRGEVHFSGCLIYDQGSEEVVKRFVARMNMINKSLIFFDPYNDIMWGCYEIDALSQIIEERCSGRVLLFLPQADNFTNGNMKFALQYAKQLDPDGRKRCLIPVRCYEDAFCPNLLRGIKELNMCGNTYSQKYWEQQSSQFRKSFSPNGSLRKACIQYYKSFYCTSDESIAQDGQTDEVGSCDPIVYPQTKLGETKQTTQHSLVDSAVEDITSFQIKHDCNSISYQNTSLDSRTDAAVSVHEADKQLHSKNAVESQPHIKKDKKKKKYLTSCFPLKRS